MVWVDKGALAVLSDAAAAALVEGATATRGRVDARAVAAVAVSEAGEPARIASQLSSPTAARSAVDARIRTQVEGEIGDVIASTPAVTQAVIDQINANPSLLEQLKWQKSGLPSGTDLNGLTTPGVYKVTSSTIATSLLNPPPGNAQGSYEVLEQANGSYLQRFTSLSGYGNIRVYTRTVTTAGTVSPWTLQNNAATLLDPDTDLDTLTTPGQWGARLPATVASLVNAPADVRAGTLTVSRISTSSTGYQGTQTWVNEAWGAAEVHTRTFTNEGFSDWREYAFTDTPAPDPDSVSLRREIMLQGSRLRHGGSIGTGGKAIIGLSFDHGFANFRDYVLPELARLGLPATVAVNTGTLGTGESLGVSYPELQAWALEYGIELANHSRSHADATGDAAIIDAIVGSLDLLHENCPEVAVDAYIMPGVSGDGYDGFAAGLPMSQWWAHVAGRTILGNHAIVTAAMLGQAVPVSGPVVAIDRVGWDNVSWANVTRDRVSAAQRNAAHLEVFMHPSGINDKIAPASVTSFLEFLAAERDAGRVEVLTVSGAAWATPDHDRVFDLADPDAWSGGQQVIPIAPLYEWARGGTFMVDAPATGAVTLGVSSDVGGLSVSRSCQAYAGRARLTFSIPTSATSITVTAPDGSRVIPV